jgi:hypothetical protein
MEACLFWRWVEGLEFFFVLFFVLFFDTPTVDDVATSQTSNWK